MSALCEQSWQDPGVNQVLLLGKPPSSAQWNKSHKEESAYSVACTSRSTLMATDQLVASSLTGYCVWRAAPKEKLVLYLPRAFSIRHDDLRSHFTSVSSSVFCRCSGRLTCVQCGAPYSPAHLDLWHCGLRFLLSCAD
jgi:hypothetical protein